jgi:hypothetical protein
VPAPPTLHPPNDAAASSTLRQFIHTDVALSPQTARRALPSSRGQTPLPQPPLATHPTASGTTVQERVLLLKNHMSNHSRRAFSSR